MSGFFTKAQNLGPAAIIMALSVFLSRFMGLIRDKVISYYYGAGPDTDIYFAAFVIPDFINYLLAGGYFSITLIPLLNRYFKENNAYGWRFFSAAFWWVVVAICVLTGIAWIFALPLAELSAPGFDTVAQQRLASFMRIILPAQACFLPGACFTALLFMRRQFAIPALTPLIYNGCIILFGLLFFYLFPGRGMEGFLWGVLAGAFAGSLLLPFLAARAGGLRLTPTLTHPGLKKFILLALPLMLGQSIVVLDEVFLRIFGSLGPEGAVSLLNYARRIMMVPVGVVAQAAGVASYPFLSSLVANGDKAGFGSTLNKALLGTLTAIIPITFLLMATAEPVMRLIFEQGRFSSADTALSSTLLIIMLCGVTFWAIQQILGRGFYAHENTLTPVLTGTLATLLTLPLYFLFSETLGAQGVALAGALSITIYTLLLTWRFKIHFGATALSGMPLRLISLLGLTLPCACLSRLACTIISTTFASTPLTGAALSLGLGALVFTLPYLCLCRTFAPSVWKETLSLFRR
ncbi:MAG: murein biosynthesis integral membrane protein MurJ [Deltaproteobacteria bacterium]|jgi:putative peptidoglycan lipid II flippase|nr:murein biosynthesis integral membrane protein MurJ [Deltaproteobacteria bacterium]